MRESWWMLEALFLILATGFATQIGSTFARNVLKRHSKSLDEHEEEYTDDLKAVIMHRFHESQEPAAKALDGYLNQVIATWALAWLDGVISLILVLRAAWSIYWRIEINALVIIAAIIGIFSVFFFLFYIATKELFGSESLQPYYGRKDVYPPNVRLTHFRIAFLSIYCLLVFAAAMPVPKPSQITTVPNVLPQTPSSTANPHLSPGRE